MISIDLNSIIQFFNANSGLFGIPLATLVGALAYRFQKSADRKSSLIELRRQAYIEYLVLLHSLLRRKNSENDLAHNGQLMVLAAIASDEVVRSAGTHARYLMGVESFDSDKARDNISETVLAMRKDCFQKTSLTIEDINKIIPFAEKLK